MDSEDVIIVFIEVYVSMEDVVELTNQVIARHLLDNKCLCDESCVECHF